MKYLVKAAPSRKVNGGIWRTKRWFTTRFHLVTLDENEVAILEKDRDIVIKKYKEGSKVKYIPEEETEHRKSMPIPQQSNLVRKMMEGSGDEDEEDDDELFPQQKEMIERAQAEAEVEETEVDRILKKQSKQVDMGNSKAPTKPQSTKTKSVGKVK
jgi:hypothetical protein